VSEKTFPAPLHQTLSRTETEAFIRVQPLASSA
jgi:hypothetical protein